ncbi:PSD1 and planctomycete cytochrome C domain-containing protein [Blastopirellula sp. JC732]|uniref:PSD1 and planctomycete cytochrome C domain-containing protein n=1 Tax=Blastopirellula sediminis TaxID=2894196 RepID=A0A9X1SDX9_9BACT|nr:PSD1 and planctomycete cytochrome C domain-containing protein [Blastopirellula sediminis]MCC9627160.1 PSD1 and planctomycete cytochrome C domain-containing protein [Blastopirellula sediminis]
MRCWVPSGAAIGAIGFTLFVIMLAATRLSSAAETSSDTKADELAAKVAILFQQKCLACHGAKPDDIKGEYDLTNRAALLRGGESGDAAVIPGEAEKSPLFLAICWDELEMPPKENDRLTKDEIKLVRQWIDAGARWPESGAEFTKMTAAPQKEADWSQPREDGRAVQTSGGLSPQWNNRLYAAEDLWAYQPISTPKIPTGGAAHPVDAFLEQKLVEQGLRPAEEVDPRTFVRRITFDLTGLPPTPEEIEQYLQEVAAGEDAKERLIDRLLAKPQYGEQMARHWLDVVRYADTAGFANDFERPNAWRYRDYVIRSFNSDRPFDQFVRQQIAGDQLEPDDSESLIATGYLRMGPWEHTAMTVAAETRQHFLDDVTHSVGVTFLGQGLRCARCHDHKFDPVPTRDYYQIQAVFAPVQFAERDLPFLPVLNTKADLTSQEALQILSKFETEQEKEANQRLESLRQELLAEYQVQEKSELPPDAQERLRKEEDRADAIRRKNRKHKMFYAKAMIRLEPLAYSVYNGPTNNYSSNPAKTPMPKEKDRQGNCEPTYILTGGSLATPSDEVSPGVLSVVNATVPELEPLAAIPTTTSGRRVAFADWVVAEQNPLTARVIVNRVWQMHFGKGIVATPNNFGKMGDRPSHPELLDWLAAWFIEHDWSIKQLHHLILTSSAYSRSSLHPDLEQLSVADPNNKLLAYFPARRLAAEEIRDSMLAISGELNPEQGGPGVFPEINWDIAHQVRYTMGTPANAWQPSPRRADRNRRTIYAFRQRTLSDPMLDVFDRPDAENSCERRNQTTVSPQVFALFNSGFSQDRAVALAQKISQQSTSPESQVELAFLAVYGRSPSGEEVKQCLAYLDAMEAHLQEHPTQPIIQPTELFRTMYDEASGGTFNYVEPLPGMNNYEYDLKPWDVSVETQALADLCLVLFNSNEFVYVR